MSTRAPSRVADLSPAARTLARLVPQVYLARDAGLPDRPLLRLLEVLAAPLAELDAAVDRMLDDHFVERAAPDVLPLLAELVGARLLGTDARTNRGVVGSTVAWRRRAGTLPTLEDVVTTTTGWPCEVDEAYRSLLVTQDVDDVLRHRGRTAELAQPVVLADPLSRRPRRARTLPPGDGPALLGELRRLGAADALRSASSPRTLDLAGWVRPERVVLRTTRLAVREVDQQEVVHVVPVAYRPRPGAPAVDRYVGAVLDPRGPHATAAGEPVPFPLAGPRPAGEPPSDDAPPREPETAPPEASRSAGFDLLTPTALAFDPDAAEAGDAVTVFVDSVPMVGAQAALPAPGPLGYTPPGPLAGLRFADVGRPAPGERWRLEVLAVDRPDALGTLAEAAAVPERDPAADNPLVLETRATLGASGPATVSDAGAVPRSGATVALRVVREEAAGYVREPGAGGGTWSLIASDPRRGSPVTPLVVVPGLPAVLLARVERRPGGGLDLALLRQDAASAWSLVDLDLPGVALDLLGDEGEDGVRMAAAGADAALLVAGPVRRTPGGPAALGLWRVEGLDAATPVARRLDDPAAPAPPDRVEATAAVASGRLWLHGGRDRPTAGAGTAGTGVRADLWSVDVTGTAARGWTRHRARHAPPRTGGRLVPLSGGLALLGGAERPGALAAGVRWIDPASDRPVWQERPDLPFAAGRPGVLEARADGDALEAVAWADTARPVTYRLEVGATAWRSTGRDAGDAPNPPAEGDAAFAGDRLLVPGPVPLPPSEVLLLVGGGGHLAFLPALDPRAGAADVLLLDADGSSRSWVPPGVAVRPGLRLGAGREEPAGERTAPAQRVGVPGRLAWRPFVLRQRNLAPWDAPLALDLDDEVALDPRLGRVLLRRDVVAGSRLAASYRTGRGDALGAGYAAPGRRPPPEWCEPADPADQDRWEPAVPPDLDADLVGGPAPVTARVLPSRAGEVLDGVPCVAGLAEAVAAEAVRIQPRDRPAVRAHVVAVASSPRLEPATLSVAQGDVVSVFPAAGGAVPHVAAEDGVSLTLQERLAPGEDPDRGPEWFLAGVSTDGAVEVGVAAGLLDVRWCDLAPPRRDDPADGGGRTGVRVVGAGTASSVPPGPPADRPLVVRLVGCVVGRLEVPPWVQVVAAGCTFDAGADAAVAVAASGAAVRMRHCTVRGRVVAGVLEASSCVLRGGVEVDRPDAGWIRYSLLDDVLDATGAAPRRPLLFETRHQRVSLVSLDSTSPYYLLPDDNNSPSALVAGERGLLPGAHGRRTHSLHELTERAPHFLPLGLAPHHVDRAAEQLRRLHRRKP